jgi:CRP-like cAMP-binding protein
MSRRRVFPFLGKGRFQRAAYGDSAPLAQREQKREYLRKQEIFRDLSPEDMVTVEHQTEMFTCPKGRIVYSQEDEAEALFLLKRGRVQLYRLTPSGKRLELATIEPGTFFGEMPLLGESLRHAFAEAAEDSLICVMSRPDVERLIREKPAVALRMIEALSRRLALSEARLEELAYKSVAARIAAVLVRLGEGSDGQCVAVTHQELGDMVGALRETVTKTLDAFRADGLVELSRGRIQLRDVAGLRARLEE